MGMRQLEAAILREARQFLNAPKLRQKDIVEWSNGLTVTQEGETMFCLPGLKINICVLNSALPKAKV